MSYGQTTENASAQPAAAPITVRDAVAAMRYYDKQIAAKMKVYIQISRCAQNCPKYTFEEMGGAVVSAEIDQLQAERREWSDFVDAQRRALPGRKGAPSR